MGSVEEFEEVTLTTDWLATFDGLLERSIEEGGGDFLSGLRGDVADGFEEAVEVDAGSGGGEDDGCVIEEEEGLLDPTGEIGERRLRLMLVARARGFAGIGAELELSFGDGGLEEVPFIDDEDAGFVG